MPSTPYTYRLRPGYNSDKLLLEFLLDDPDGEFEKDLFSTLKEINPVIGDVQDLWMNDEVLFSVSCSYGSFLLSKDIWGFAFIMAEENQECIMAIDEILKGSSVFKKEEVDYSIYSNQKKEES